MQTHLFLCLLDSRPTVGPMKLPLPVCLSVRLFVRLSVSFAFFSGMGHYFLLIFCTIVDNWNIEKFAELFFSRKIHFCPNFDKKGLKRTRNSFFWIFLKMLSLLLFGSNLNWELMLLLMFHYQSNIWQNSGSLVMSQNALGQSNKNLSVLQVNTIILGVTRHAQNTQNKNFVYLHYLQKSKRDVVDFSPADNFSTI